MFCRVGHTPMVLDQTYRKEVFCFNLLIQFLIYLYLETTPIIVFQGIILHTNISLLPSRVTLLMLKYK